MEIYIDGLLVKKKDVINYTARLLILMMDINIYTLNMKQTKLK